MSFDKLLDRIKEWESGGVRKLSNGSTLYCHVPHVAPEAWFHKVYRPLNLEEIDQLQQGVSQVIPTVFKEFLQRSNGLNIFSNNLQIFGLRKSFVREGDEAIQPYHLPSCNKERPFLAPRSRLYFGGYGFDGSYVFFDTKENTENGKVYYCKKDSNKVLHEWDSFWDWLMSEVDRILKLYDSNGVRINTEISILLK